MKEDDEDLSSLADVDVEFAFLRADRGRSSGSLLFEGDLSKVEATMADSGPDLCDSELLLFISGDD